MFRLPVVRCSVAVWELLLETPPPLLIGAGLALYGTSLCRTETDTDALAEGLVRKLFAMEAELGVGTVFWYEMIGWIADVADYAERVGNRLRLLIAS